MPSELVKKVHEYEDMYGSVSKWSDDVLKSFHNKFNHLINSDRLKAKIKREEMNKKVEEMNTKTISVAQAQGRMPRPKKKKVVYDAIRWNAELGMLTTNNFKVLNAFHDLEDGYGIHKTAKLNKISIYSVRQYRKRYSRTVATFQHYDSDETYEARTVEELIEVIRANGMPCPTRNSIYTLRKTKEGVCKFKGRMLGIFGYKTRMARIGLLNSKGKLIRTHGIKLEEVKQCQKLK